jgi:hypothetical protein
MGEARRTGHCPLNFGAILPSGWKKSIIQQLNMSLRLTRKS